MTTNPAELEKSNNLVDQERLVDRGDHQRQKDEVVKRLQTLEEGITSSSSLGMISSSHNPTTLISSSFTSTYRSKCHI